MPRPLKFRAFYKPDIDAGKSFLFTQKIINHDIKFVCESHRYSYPMTISEIFLDNDWIIQQFTGLLDKDGKGIYEGDIVEEIIKHCDDDPNSDYTWQTKEVFEIYWNDKKFGFFMKGGKYKTDKRTLPEVGAYLNVIGNIYENP